MTEPDLKLWAESIVFLARDGLPASEKTLKAVEDELRVIAKKYKQLGDRNTWWEDQEAQWQTAKEKL